MLYKRILLSQYTACLRSQSLARTWVFLRNQRKFFALRDDAATGEAPNKSVSAKVVEYMYVGV